MKLRSVLATTAAIAATALVASPASAQSTTVIDGADATASLTDIRVVTLAHQSDKVVVRTEFTDVRRVNSAGLRIHIDTNPNRVGPEYRLVSGLSDGTDYALLRVRDWKVVGDMLTCTHRFRINWDTDIARFEASCACLGNPTRVRVGMRMTDNADSSHVVSDDLIGFRQFTAWRTAG